MIKLTAAQIKALAEFAEADGSDSYRITEGHIPAFDTDDDQAVPAYSGLIAYSDSEDGGVLQLD